MDIWRCLISGFMIRILIFGLFSDIWCTVVLGLGSMSSIATSYGENGPVFCGLKPDGSHIVNCYGSDSAVIYATPTHFTFKGLTAGNGFVCGLLMYTNQPYCWGSSGFIQMGVPQPMITGSEYMELSAGDHHLCGLRKPLIGKLRNLSMVDCWGYNMTLNYVFDGQIQSISAGSEFNCGLFSQNRTVFCWGDETSSGVISLIPKEMRFRKISAGGFHVCGVLESPNSRVFCWGRSLDPDEEEKIPVVVRFGRASVNMAPNDPILSVVGGRFHACGIKSYDRGVVCWGYHVKKSTPPPNGVKLYAIAAGDYFTCGVLAEKSLLSICWGAGYPSSLPVAVSPGLCNSSPCEYGFYKFENGSENCKPGSHICLPCTSGCHTAEMFQNVECTSVSDRQCEFNCSSCVSAECFSNCSASTSFDGTENRKFWSLQAPIIIAEAAFSVFLVCVVSLTTILYVRYKLRNCRCSAAEDDVESRNTNGNVNGNTSGRVQSELGGEVKMIRSARMFSYEELERATDGFKEESQVGKGSFSCVFKGVLNDGTTVAVKRALMSLDMNKDLKEFHNELDLLSRLNHAHLLSLLGYCEEGKERLLVYEFMGNGSLHQHLHGESKGLNTQLDWIRRVTIAVQAARGIEYLHGYACPPVIHRDIKSSNILIDEEHNARVADFGLSLLGPASSSSPLAELPAGTLGYLDPEYYRLHYLTTKSDVYSFGVLLLEILSGRKAIDMQYEEGNIVEWAVPLIKAGDVESVLDPKLELPTEIEAVKRIANVASKCVRMRGKERPSMDKVTTALEQALAQMIGRPPSSSEQTILPSEVVLGSSRLHKKSSHLSSNRSGVSETTEEVGGESEDQPPSWITYTSIASSSSHRRKSSVSEGDCGNGGTPNNVVCEIVAVPSPQENLFLQHNF